MEIKTYAPPTIEEVELSAEGIFCLSGEDLERMNYEEFQW